MSNITVSNLNPAGSDLFSDSESYLRDLSQTELKVQGGAISTPLCAVVTIGVLVGSAIINSCEGKPHRPIRQND